MAKKGKKYTHIISLSLIIDRNKFSLFSILPVKDTSILVSDNVFRKIRCGNMRSNREELSVHLLFSYS